MSDSGPPAHWPFVLFSPSDFRVPMRAVTRVFLHCSAWDNEVMNGTALTEEINRWHIAQGWRGVGYHFVISKDGSISTARPLSETPAAQLGKDNRGNIATIAIMTQGNWHFTEKSLESTLKLCEAIDKAYKDENKPVTFHGHCEIDPKPCPVYQYRELLGLDQFGNFMATAHALPATVAEASTRSVPKAQTDDHDE